jgi:hypothetical protein
MSEQFQGVEGVDSETLAKRDGIGMASLALQWLWQTTRTLTRSPTTIFQRRHTPKQNRDYEVTMLVSRTSY